MKQEVAKMSMPLPMVTHSDWPPKGPILQVSSSEVPQEARLIQQFNLTSCSGG